MCCVRDLELSLVSGQFYISSFLAVFLTVLVTRPQQRWSQVVGLPQAGVADSQEQQVRDGPPKPQPVRLYSDTGPRPYTYRDNLAP